MATQFASSFPTRAPAPFILAGAGLGKDDTAFAAALRKAAKAEQASNCGVNPRQRIASFLCELGKVLGCRDELPLSRSALASALGISLVRVKRTLAMLSLSGVVSCEGDAIQVLDWRKLIGAARFDPTALDFEDGDEADPESFLIVSADAETENSSVTASGDPACFV